jgi:hypothetical protein
MDDGARLGLVAYGIVHILVAVLALGIAWRVPTGTSANTTGALRTLATEPLGRVLLWGVAAGFAALVLWQLGEALLGHRDKDGTTRTVERLGSAGRVAVYAALGYAAVRIAAGSSGGTEQPDEVSTSLMRLPAGPLLVAGVGLVIAAIGAYLVYKGLSGRSGKHLTTRGRSGTAGTWAVRVGQFGHVAKGVALILVGALFGWAAVTYDPRKAGGLDVALHQLRDQPFGPPALTVVAVGIGCFGLYCFAWARHAADT